MSHVLDSELSPRLQVYRPRVGLRVESKVAGEPRVGLRVESQVAGEPRVGLRVESQVAGKPRVGHRGESLILNSNLSFEVHL